MQNITTQNRDLTGSALTENGKNLKGDNRMTNKEWIATLPKETWWDVVHEWLFREYGMQWTDTRRAVMEWLEKEHEPITSYRNGMTWK